MLKKYEGLSADQFRIIAQKEYLTVSEAAIYFGFGHNTMCKIFSSLPSDAIVSVGRRRYAHREKLSRYFENSDVIST